MLGAEIHPGMKYRLRVITGQGVRRGGIMPEVSWTSNTHVGGVSGLVDLFRTTFVFEINSSRYFSSTGQIIGQTVRRGGGSMFDLLEGVVGYGYPICNHWSALSNFVYKVFRSWQPLSVPEIIGKATGGGRFDVRCVRGVW